MGSDGSRFDFAFISTASFAEFSELVKCGESFGFRGMWIPDQTFYQDPFALLAASASMTQQIQLGLGVTNPFTRLPVQIARATATIDEMSGGRFKLGLGAGNLAHVLTPLGISNDRSIGRLRDAIHIIKTLLRGEIVDFESTDFTLRSIQLDFAPLRPNVPIYLGTRGPQTLALAGEIADGVLIESLFNADGLSYAFNNIGKGASRSGRSMADFDAVSWQLVQVTDDVQSAVDARRAWMARKIRIGPASALMSIGIKPGVIEAVNVQMDREGPQAAMAEVTDETIQCAMIIGEPDNVAARITEILGKGVDAIGLLLLGQTNEIHNSLERFAKEVLPLIDA